MTTTALTKIEPKREPGCPDWCAGHTETYQSWEVFDSGPVRYHSSHAAEPITSTLAHPAWADDSASVEVTLLETPGAMTAVAVTLIVGDGSVDLTPDQARRYVDQVLSAITLAELPEEGQS